jgi:hypothetical protein
MSHKTVVIYSNQSDPIAEILSDRLNVKTYHIDDLSDFIDFDEWPNVVTTRFGEKIKSEFKGAQVVNRLFTLHDTAMSKRLTELVYREEWAHVALSPLLSSASSLVHDTGVKGISRCLLPLNSQWLFIGDRGIDVPTYVYSFGGSAPDLSNIKDPMQKSIWSLHDWREEKNFGPDNVNWHPFYVERPTGTPVLCNFIRDDVNIVVLRGATDKGVDDFRPMAKIVSQVFRSQMGEFLTYVESDGTIRFYAFTPTLHASVQQDSTLATRLSSFVNVEFDAGTKAAELVSAA